jgi:hypothetical protein
MTLGSVMAGSDATRTMRLGGMMFAGAALLAAAALGLEWRLAPSLLRNSFVEIVLVGAGFIVLCVALLLLNLGRPTGTPVLRESSSPLVATSEASLMALPAIVADEPADGPHLPTPEPVVAIAPAPSVAASTPAGLAAESPSNSTLLIPFADIPAPPVRAPDPPIPAPTVSRLVDRMDAIQRVAPAAPTSTPPSEHGPLGSALLLRLTRIPIPPAAPSATSAPRRCTDCGDPLGTPPQFEPCGDCGRALCERCYWRTSSGPAAHLCTTCFQDRSVPRPPAPAVTFARPVPAVSASAPSGRTLRPRRPVS